MVGATCSRRSNRLRVLQRMRYSHASATTRTHNVHTGRVIYGNSYRARLASDAEAMVSVVPADGIWRSVFLAVAIINKSTIKALPEAVKVVYEAIVNMQRADCGAGTVFAALWMGRALVRLVCRHKLVPLAQIPDAILTECGFREEDMVESPSAAQKLADAPGKRTRAAAKTVIMEKLGGSISKKQRTSQPGCGEEENRKDGEKADDHEKEKEEETAYEEEKKEETADEQVQADRDEAAKDTHDAGKTPSGAPEKHPHITSQSSLRSSSQAASGVQQISQHTTIDGWEAAIGKCK